MGLYDTISGYNYYIQDINNQDINKGDFFRFVDAGEVKNFIYRAVTQGHITTQTASDEPSNIVEGQIFWKDNVGWYCLDHYISDYLLDLILQTLQSNINYIAICTNIPIEFYEAYVPDEWTANTSYSVGALVRPTNWTQPGIFEVKEITGSGTSGSTEPNWPTSIDDIINPDYTITDNEITWRPRPNYALAHGVVDMASISQIEPGIHAGRVLKITQTMSALVDKSGEAKYVAFCDTNNKKILLVNKNANIGTVTAGEAIGINYFSYEIVGPGYIIPLDQGTGGSGSGSGSGGETGGEGGGS